jgi:hypothetical protein
MSTPREQLFIKDNNNATPREYWITKKKQVKFEDDKNWSFLFIV